MPDERLQKVLARAGVASRRHAEELITAGRVRVDGRIERELGVKVSSRARIEVDGRVVVAEPLVYLVLHKPRGVVCTLKDPEGRPTVADYLKDVGARVVPVGRLDFHTSGALICTNDGELASHLMHPRYHARKEYVAKVGGVVNEETLEKLKERIVIDGRATRPADVTLLRVEEGKSWLSVKLGEGRNRQVRRLGEHAGVPVMRLARVAHAGITAESLRPGEWRMLTIDELKAMKREYGVPRRIHGPDARLGEMRGGHVTLRQPKARDARTRQGEPRKDTAPRRDGGFARGDERRETAPRRDGRSRPGDERRETAPRRDGRSRPGDERRDVRPRPGDERRDARPRPGDERRDTRARPGDQRRDTRRDDRARPRHESAPRRDEAPARRDARRPAPPARERGPSGRGGRGSGPRRGT